MSTLRSQTFLVAKASAGPAVQSLRSLKGKYAEALSPPCPPASAARRCTKFSFSRHRIGVRRTSLRAVSWQAVLAHVSEHWCILA